MLPHLDGKHHLYRKVTYPQGTVGGACYACGASQRTLDGGDKERLVDLGRTIDFEGFVMICETCVVEAAQLLGMATQADIEAITAGAGENLAAVAAAEERATRAEELVVSLRRYDGTGAVATTSAETSAEERAATAKAPPATAEERAATAKAPPATVATENFDFRFQGYTNPGSPVILMGPTSGNTTKVLSTNLTTGIGAAPSTTEVAPIMTVGTAGGTRVWHWDQFWNIQICPSVGFNYDPQLGGRTDLLLGFAINGLRLGNPGQAQDDTYSPAAGAKVNGGPGVPSTTQCPAGEFYFRTDGGGAGATHVYFNNAGAVIGIA